MTITATRGLASALRNRAGNYLLVLTEDYERIDFVLLEKYLPRVGPGATHRRASGRHPAGSHRRPSQPEQGLLRVLRRLNYTEPDPFAQYDKLLSAFDIADWSEEHFNNRALFSDHYLRERLPELPRWEEDPKPAFRGSGNSTRGSREAAGPTSRKRMLRAAFSNRPCRSSGFSSEPMKPATDDSSSPTICLRASDGTGRWSSLPGLSLGPLPRRQGRPAGQPTRRKRTPARSSSACLKRRSALGRSSPTASSGGSTPPDPLARHQLLRDRSGRGARQPLATIRARRSATSGCSSAATRSKRARQSPMARARTLFVPRPAPASRARTTPRNSASGSKDRIFEEIFPHLARVHRTHPRSGRARSADDPKKTLDEVFQGTLTLALPAAVPALRRSARPAAGQGGARLLRGEPEKLKQESPRRPAIADEADDSLRKAYRQAQPMPLRPARAAVPRRSTAGDPAVNVPIYNGGLFLTEADPDDDEPRGRERPLPARPQGARPLPRPGHRSARARRRREDASSWSSSTTSRSASASSARSTKVCWSSSCGSRRRRWRSAREEDRGGHSLSRGGKSKRKI